MIETPHAHNLPDTQDKRQHDDANNHDHDKYFDACANHASLVSLDNLNDAVIVEMLAASNVVESAAADDNICRKIGWA
jgi:hypothetical protein